MLLSWFADPTSQRNFASGIMEKAKKSILLFGPPGCGKTLAIRAWAKTYGYNFISVTSSNIKNKYHGKQYSLNLKKFYQT